MLLAQRPNLHAQQKETQRVNNTAGRRQLPINANAFLKRFTRRTNQRERGHCGSKNGHQQQNRTDGMTGQHVVAAGPFEQTAGEQTQAQQ